MTIWVLWGIAFKYGWVITTFCIRRAKIVDNAEFEALI